MTEKERDKLFAEADKALEKAKKKKKKPLTKEEMAYREEFLARCEAEGRCKKIVLNKD